MFDVDRSLIAAARQDAEGTWKVIEDLDRYLVIIRETKPTVIIECGTYYGGSAKWFRRQGLRVVTIDIDPTRMVHGDPGILSLQGDSADNLMATRVSNYLQPDDRVMVSLDSNHFADHVKEEIKIWSPAVTSGCYLVVEDGIVRWMNWADSPLDAVETLLWSNPKWERDEMLEDLYDVSMCPMGWWRRK